MSQVLGRLMLISRQLLFMFRGFGCSFASLHILPATHSHIYPRAVFSSFLSDAYITT